MRRNLILFILTLVCSSGAWATAYRGDVSIDLLYTTYQSGDSIALSSQLVNSDKTRYRPEYAVSDPVIDSYFGVDMNYTQPFSDFISDASHSNYRLLNPNAAVEEYFVVSGITNTWAGGSWIQPWISGRLSGFYTQAEMADALDAVREAMTYKVDDATLAGYKADVNNAVITDARSIYDNRRALILQYDANQRAQEQERLRLLAEAKEAAIAEIDAALCDITDATLLATVQSYKDQINAATVIEAINPIKVDALAAIAAYKTEQERLRLLVEAKEAAIASIQALVSGSTDELVISTANKYIALIEAAMVIEDVTRLRSEAESLINRLLSEPTAFEFGFVIGSNNPTETQHTLKGVKMTYSADGEDMTVTINGKAVTYPLSQVSELTYFRGTPTITLSTTQNPLNASEYVTTFHSGLEAYAIPEGVRAYTAEVNAAQTAVILTAIEGGVLPQGEAVLLYTDVAGAITMNTVVSDATASETNQLLGTDVRDETPDNCMALNSAAGAFQHYTGQYFPANKAYLVSNAQAPLRIGFSAGQTDTATGMESGLINENENVNANANVSKVLRNGMLYIIKDGRTYTAQGMLVNEYPEH